MTELKHPAQTLLYNPDGFRIEIDEQRQRADIILDRPSSGEDPVCACWDERLRSSLS